MYYGVVWRKKSVGKKGSKHKYKSKAALSSEGHASESESGSSEYGASRLN